MDSNSIMIKAMQDYYLLYHEIPPTPKRNVQLEVDLRSSFSLVKSASLDLYDIDPHRDSIYKVWLAKKQVPGGFGSATHFDSKIMSSIIEDIAYTKLSIALA